MTGRHLRRVAAVAGCLAWTAALVAVATVAHHQAQRAITAVGDAITVVTSTEGGSGR